MRQTLLPTLPVILLTLLPPASGKQPVDDVNPLIGAGSMEGKFKGFHGKTFPGAATPAGMVQLSPDTIIGGDNGGGYSYAHTTIQGFSVNHLTGVGAYGDLGNFLVTPTTGPLKTYCGETDKPGSGYLSSYAKESEVAQAGYYAVTLKDYDIRTELTATPRCGMMRFTFPENPASRIQIDLARRIGGTSLWQKVRVVNDHTLEGEIFCSKKSGGFKHNSVTYTLYFHAELDKPLTNVGIWDTKLPADVLEFHDRRGSHNPDIPLLPSFIEACKTATLFPGCREREGQHLGFFTEFPTKKGDQALLKVGLSYVSIEGAAKNLAAEIPAWDFDKTHAEARELWSRTLDRIDVEGGTQEQKTIFYTCLYHALIDPRIYADVDGNYPGGDGKIHNSTAFTKRTVFSGWDVYRSQFPLLTIIYPEVINDEINSQIELAEQNGKRKFDRWELMNCYTGCMNGTPSITIINDAYQKGIRSYDVGKAYEFCVNSDPNPPLGYVPDNLSANFENSFHDWNLSRLAASLGKKEDAEKYHERSLSYRQLFDPEVPWTYDRGGKDSRPEWKGWFRRKDEKGAWMPWEGLLSGAGVTEGSAYQQGWHAPHDVSGLITLLGGREKFVAKLDDFFSRTPDFFVWNGYDNPSNEPSNLIPFLFNRAGAPWLTQKWVREVVNKAYFASPNGMPGDDDEGQMSAWYVLAASGLHQLCPGDTRFEIFTPIFDKVTFTLDPKYTKGGTFVITARNNSPANCYIQSATLNGKPLDRCWLDYKEISAGGTLELTLGSEPNKQWGLAEK